jgi:hypothetical protein
LELTQDEEYALMAREYENIMNKSKCEILPQRCLAHTHTQDTRTKTHTHTHTRALTNTHTQLLLLPAEASPVSRRLL